MSWSGDWELPELLREPLADRERLALVALSMSGLGPAALARELSAARSVEEALARREDAPSLDQARKRLDRASASAMVPGDEGYPDLLRSISAAPPLLFVRGRSLATLQPCVAIVGARICTPGGARFASALGERLALEGYAVVSGLARGIDAAAHIGALRVGTSIAVLGNGIDIVYPSEHRGLCREAADHGCVLTEFPPGVRPRAWHFPARNRIISALSVAVVVVEAGERSGALITADFALEQGREVLACVVSPTTPSGAGVRAILKQGARMVVDVDHALEQVEEVARGFGFETRQAQRAARVPPELSGIAARVHEAILEQTTVDEIVERTGETTARVSAALAALELEGVIVDDGGGRWRRST